MSISSQRNYFESWYLVGRILHETKKPMDVLRLHVFFAAIQRKWFEQYGYMSWHSEQFFFTGDIICVKSIVDAIEQKHDDVFIKLFVIESDPNNSGITIALREGMEQHLFTEDYEHPLAVSGSACEALVDCLLEWLPSLNKMGDEQLLAHSLGIWNPQKLEEWISWEDYIATSTDFDDVDKKHIIENHIHMPRSMDKIFASL